MSRFSQTLTIVLVAATATSATDPPSDSGFDAADVRRIHLEFSAAEYRAIQPVAPTFPAPGGAPAPERVDDDRATERNFFGVEFPWAEAVLSIGDDSVSGIRVRYDGGITYMASARSLKRPLAIRMENVDDHAGKIPATFRLHSMPLDQSKAREAVAFSVFSACGVDAPRAVFAEVTLTVPGEYNRETLGLYTLVEGVDNEFLAQHFGNGGGLLMEPFGMRGIDFLGEDWSAYVGRYRPNREATGDEAERVIEFARLINQGTDEEFEERIDSLIDVDEFLRFMAANALTSNLESFFALGHNYYLYLDSDSARFHFVPASLGFSFANFLLMGTPDQLLDLSVDKPYPGDNRLPDRLLAIDRFHEKYTALLKELTSTVFTAERLQSLAESAEQATRQFRENEAEAIAAREESPPGFGMPAAGPRPPSLADFALARTESIAEQLSGARSGFVPQPLNFGQPPSGGNGRRGNENTGPIDEATFNQIVEAPPEFEVSLFATSPEVNYPVAIAAAPSGDVYVAIDEQGSLGRTPGGGRIVRCRDVDDDGKADEVSVYARVDHPRGLCYRNGSVWVMHPPTLSVFRDEDGDGIAEAHDVLVTGLTTEQIEERGGDHTTNCVRMGIDGWLYIGVGDYGILKAEGTDGRTISLRGGGVVRVRPDGTELEIYCTGLRNPFDLAIDPFLNLFTRDNTNDGAGWDTRVSHLIQSAEYGYARLFANFTDEIMPTLGAFGGGGGTGGLFVQDPAWPDRYGNTLYTGDWGRSEVYRHPLSPHGASFDLEQDVFMSIPRATGMDVDGSGRMYVASWWGGEAAVHVGPHVGFVTRVVPEGLRPDSFPVLADESLDELTALLATPRSVTRLHAQGEILSRKLDTATMEAMFGLASSKDALPEGRVAALFTLKQLAGPESHPLLLRLTQDPVVREFALRCLTDRTSELENLDAAPFIAALDDESPRVRAQAVISLGRLNDPAAAPHILPLTSPITNTDEPPKRPHQNDADPDRVVPHLAVKSLVALDAVEPCLEALDGLHWRGALWAMRSMHSEAAVEGLIKALSQSRADERRREILITLMRLYHREAEYDGSWWGIRPDTTGPYYDRVKWEMSDRIESVLTVAVLDSDAETAELMKAELQRHQVSLPGVPVAANVAAAPPDDPIVIPKADPDNPDQIGNLVYEEARQRVLAGNGDPNRGEKLFQANSCIACHTTADGQTPKGPHLVNIGQRYKADELVESILRPSKKLAQGYEMYSFSMVNGRVFSGFIVSERADATLIRESNGVQRELPRSEIDARVMQKVSAMPERLVDNLTPAQLADLVAFLQSLQ